MKFNRAKKLDQDFAVFVKEWAEHRAVPPQRLRLKEPIRQGSKLNGQQLLDCFDSMLTSRHLDLMARELRARDAGFYTIGSCGHEGNVVLGLCSRYTDPAFLHYRSGALFVQRTKQLPDQNPIRDILLGMVASSEEPIAGGRHKVFGSRPLWVPPQTSTIASHVPKAVGAAVALRRAKRRDWDIPIPTDSIVLCSFGDASVNHATALAGFNAARWLSYQKLPVPILFVCEDNHWGISVRTPPGWIEHSFGNRPGLTYFSADGGDIVEAHAVASRAIEHCREQRMPAFLHLRMVRLLGHAGSDMELEYRDEAELEEVERQDPIQRVARLILDLGLLTPDEMTTCYEAVREQVTAEADYAVQRPKLTDVDDIMRPLAPLHADAVASEAARLPSDEARRSVYPKSVGLPEDAPPRHLAVMINYALREMMLKYSHSLLFGEDVARKGGVYNVTSGLSEVFGAGRVFNTLLDETDILGLALGSGMVGVMPIPEIQYLAYFHNACDQIRGEASSLQFFSNAQFSNPMVVRIAAFAYQKGFGGHFHNDNSIAALRDIPGVIIAAPARGDDAVEMLRTCFALAHVDGRVVLFLEPIAMYMVKDLYAPKDGQWVAHYPQPGVAAGLGEGRVYHSEGSDLTIVTYCNGVHMFQEEHGISARVFDLRWLQPLNAAQICEQAGATGRLLVVDESRHTGSLSEPIFASMVDNGLGHLPMGRVTAADCFIPLGAAALEVLPSEADIVDAALKLVTIK
jgi:2-oxoisovalerate dehydrogenase E1 component